MIAYTPTLVSRPANTAVTGAGAVGVGVGQPRREREHRGLMPNATSSTAKIALRVPVVTSCSRSDNSAMFSVPVVA